MADTATTTENISIERLATEIVQLVEQPEHDWAVILQKAGEFAGVAKSEAAKWQRERQLERVYKPDSKVMNAWNNRDIKLKNLVKDLFNVLEMHLIDESSNRDCLADFIGIYRIEADLSANRTEVGKDMLLTLCEVIKDSVLVAKIEGAGFGKKRPLEALSSLEFLLSLHAGIAVADKTWGYGVIRAEDGFEKCYVIDFDRKKNHTIGFAFAADTLDTISADHILAVQHADAAAFRELCEKDSAKVVELALKSFGDMTIGQLQARLEDGILPSGVDWKQFWRSARAHLSFNKHFIIPPATKRNVPIEYVENPEEYAKLQESRKYSNFKELRDSKEILDHIATFIREGVGNIPAEGMAAIKNRLAYVMRASVADSRIGNKGKVEAINLALQLGIEKMPMVLGGNPESMKAEFAFEGDFVSGGENIVLMRDTIALPSVLLDAALTLSASKLREAVNALDLDKNEVLANEYVKALASKVDEDEDEICFMPASLISSVMPKLIKGVGREALKLRLNELFAMHTPPYGLLCWFCHAISEKNADKVLAGIATPFSVMSLALPALANISVSGEDLKMRNDIKKLFLEGGHTKDRGRILELNDGAKWTLPLLEKMTPSERADIFVRLQALESVWEPLKKRSLVASILTKFPNLEDFIPSEVAEEEEKGFFADNITSTRTYRERAAALKKLMEEEMPANRRDIEHAKSFGDLSENFEYESAKNTERSLIARQQQLEKDLKDISGFDFATQLPDSNGLVGIGSCVTLEGADGIQVQYSVLGVWDSEPSLGIVSCLTPIAKAILDHKVDDEVYIGAGDDAKAMRIVAVEPLPQSVIDWAR